jgi:2-polyprenyl-3-methyl-5-hydroxy-6-metoxy-1,4-benzoquinol methylase
MKPFDRLLQYWRIKKVLPYLKPGDRVLDIGCADGALFRYFPAIGEGIGIDPTIEKSVTADRVRLIRGSFPNDVPPGGSFDAITMIAVLEHLLPKDQALLANACFEKLKPGGLVLITVPSTRVDTILVVLKFLRIVDGMSLEEHHGFNPDDSPTIFAAAGPQLIRKQKFQLGFNRLFVFQKPQ